MVKINKLILLLLAALMFAGQVLAGDKPDKGELQSLDGEVQVLKEEVLELNRELMLLEEELLFPASTQVSVFLSLDVGKYFRPSSIKLKIDDKVVSYHLYTESDITALKRGGVQRLFTGNYKLGKHELVAFVIGSGQRARQIKLGTSVEFNKDDDPKYIELKIKDVKSKRQPVFDTKVWD
jgi:hypothetical protein